MTSTIVRTDKLNLGITLIGFIHGVLIWRQRRRLEDQLLHYADGEIDAFETVLCLKSELNNQPL